MRVLALDIGTSSTRAALFDARARIVPGSLYARPYRLRTGADGTAELDMARLARAAETCIDAALAVLPSRERIIGVGISCFWHSLLGSDAGGAPRSPIYTWADGRAGATAAALRRRHQEARIHRTSGCMLRASFWPAKLTWLRESQPRLLRQVAYWLSPAEWLLWQWCGERVCAHGMATGTGLYDPRGLRWSSEILRTFALEERWLSPLSDAPLRLSPRWAQRWPALAGAAVFPGIGDGAASNLGSGAAVPGVAAINVGTSAAVRLVRGGRLAEVPLGLFCYRIDRDRALIGGAISNAGSVVDWCRRTLRLPRDLDAAMAGDVPTSLQALPYLLPERAPSWRDDLPGVVAGLTQATTAVELLRALTTASYQRLGCIVDLLPGRPTHRWVLGGGITHSPAAVQRLCDVLGVPLTMTREHELSLRGAAVLALERTAQPPPGPPALRVVRPRLAAHRRYRAQRPRLQALEDRLFGGPA